MKNKILHIFEPTFDFNTINSESKLLVDVDQLNGSEYHISLGDMTSSEILRASKHFDSVNFVPDGFDVDSDIYKESVLLLSVIKNKKPITGYNFDDPIKFLSHDVISRPDCPVLWVFGCSYSHGVGLHTFEKSYGQILSESLNLPLLKITRSGSSLNWSFRHLINANIKPMDYVVWQITSPDRVSVFDNSVVKEVQLSLTKNRSLLDVNTDEQLFFDHVNLMNAGINYLRLLSARFSLLSLNNKSPYFYNYLIEYSKHPEYCHEFDFKDFGTDDLHPGPLSHQAVANHLLDHIQYLYD